MPKKKSSCKPASKNNIKQTKLKTTEQQYKEESEIYSIIGNNQEFLNYREKLTNLDGKHLMLVGGTKEEKDAYVKFIWQLGFKQSVSVECTSKNRELLKEKIINSIYTYYSEEDSYKNLRCASTSDIQNKNKEYRRGKRTLSNYRLCILDNVYSVNNDLWCELAVRIRNEKHGQFILIAIVQNKKESIKLPETWCNLFDVVSLDGKEKKLRGKKKPYIPEKEKSKIINDIIKTYPSESNTFIARKVMSEIKKQHGNKPDGKPRYTEKTLAKEVSMLKNKKTKQKVAK